ncbi:MAG: hypothetical protein A2700_01290 [Candidatus Blackburnbacteria bacterium RIFCSPHIGHO2_01_FULL_44_64]|uniref:Uncharacterized protein n=1 Tax=Candidatus Blackburnbacteria bacterium RIFCSPHIGHO2_02_FULL_44_20 TaxID=1797516 RepID=A0A1G1V6I2_9BACT|nr:MAG: hypothetical protein A2700_01290 [Candidatus Blackburnbacteria bacterium RIFCSPHIGHO2_01_FULL_44_64]OGY10718.1 MAG: hypothetical protein A3E16_01825 [Candidatus Blackburnbacteria bacterium RIFCSPHIGHO2_12_FULL_44_25]OGY11020.1 MAG: hypothetical protein A3D26_03835 [Candidatus Blackburnbacteria bacterium RIFCSPHIGHO2_02_FULL_44_20]OGY15849.1 MAG: hypothetical protein A3H88_01490 [Candidatus Blackburnbacteria bacterium RIFCSPLOWO2_02_FULL_44_9]
MALGTDGNIPEKIRRFIYNLTYMAAFQPTIKRKPIEELFIYKNLMYGPSYKTHINIDRTDLHIDGPYCPKCRGLLSYKNNTQPLGGLSCTVCNFQCSNEKDIAGLREAALRAFEANQRLALRVVSLDLPPGVVKAENENEDYWVEARIGQKDGKLQGMILMGRKVKDQSKKDYVQIILDPEEEQMRFDKGNQNPMELLAKIEVEFQKSKVRQEGKD